MKKLYYLLLAGGFFVHQAIVAQVIRPFTPRYTNTSVRGNIRFVSNNIITTAGAITTEMPPAGTATNNNGAGVNIDVDNAPNTTLFTYNDAWKYLDNGTDQGTAWTPSAFSDASWKTNNGKFGYGDAVNTVVFSGCGTSAYPGLENATPGSCGGKYITTYFRKTINIPNPALFAGFLMNVYRDDGIVVYINGVEVVRDNMPAGAIAYNTLAPAAASDDGQLVNAFPVSSAAFIAGNNTIAVEMHQNGATSTDLTFGMELMGVPINNNTYNSSSGDLLLTSCSEVLWAGLYWGASLGNSGDVSWKVGYDTILLKVPGAPAYTKVVAAQTDLHHFNVGSNHNGYSSFANVTSLVNAINANGTYTIANEVVPVATGLKNQAAGWTLVIVYKNNIEIPRNLVVFDGFSIVGTGTQNDIKIGGFVTPLTGPVSCELGAVCYDGDRGSSDGFFFKQDSVAAGVYTDLTPNGTSNTSDMWNSTISFMGANVTSRNPAHANTLGYDADMVQLPNPGNAALGNNMTSARIRISSPSSGGENFFLQVVTSAISVANPSFYMVKTSTDLSGGSWLPGDSLQYKVYTLNNATDTSTNTVITDTLPANVNYKPGSLAINNIAKTDAAGDDEAEYDPISRSVIFRIGTGANAVNGGLVIMNKLDSVSFKVNATDICQIIACNAVAANQARIDYTGKNSLQSLFDHSGYLSGGCFVEGPITNTIAGTCVSRGDTSLVNQCPSLSVTLPFALYTGYTFYHGVPFITANQINPATPITAGSTYYAFWSSGSGCYDTVRFNVLVQPCPDIDDDNDGIPDYIESNGADAFADDDNNGIPNFTDAGYPGFIDSNNDGVNDHFDADLDGIPNQLDLDSDNDGIPDVVEAGGVDADGDGRIDNYTDTDNDGLSQNVDANNTGQIGSGNGLGLRDTDGDGVPDYLDLDSDNDGIPDVTEAGGIDVNNDGKIDNYTDSDADGYADAVDGDVGNDGVSENSANALLKTGADTNNDGRADSYPNKNMDNDSKPNPYDLDSDGDGITDTREAGFIDADSNGQVDGAIGINGWNAGIDAMPSLALLNTDAAGKPDYLDIDADDDGIPDNVEGIATSSYLFPSYTDSDGDGIDDAYDSFAGFGGNGITPNDQDGDGIPDYRDLDTDADGSPDIIEGNDFNGDCKANDNTVLTGMDTDGDGLDDRFDSNNASPRATSAYMGTGGSLTGDPTPGSVTVVQKCNLTFERDWRYQPYVLVVNFLQVTGVLANQSVKLQWTVTADHAIDRFDVERSADGISFGKIAEAAGSAAACTAKVFTATDNHISEIQGTVWYYRIRAVSKNTAGKWSNLVVIRVRPKNTATITPNPANDVARISLAVKAPSSAKIFVLDAAGKQVLQQTQQLYNGVNAFEIVGISKLQNGVYMVQVILNQEVINHRLIIQR
ncbi:MAG: T9SS type A sorting domain-containing protein [Chitinophagaceae bacterium]